MKFLSITYLLRLLYIGLHRRNSLIKTTLNNGEVVYGINKPGYGGRGIFLYRDAIQPEFEHLDEFLKQGNVFVDIGANTGIFSIKAAKCVGPNGIVIAIEPYLSTLAILQKSVAENNFTNVRMRNFCIDSKTGVRTFYENFGKPNSFSMDQRDPNATPLSVLAISLDDLFNLENIDQLDYLKIDAEGAENQALIGAYNIINKCRPIIQIFRLKASSMADLPIPLVNYSMFQAKPNLNSVFVPNEHTEIDRPVKLGWNRISG